jgi:RNA polymerase sigma-70 factor, ECF subfamily
MWATRLTRGAATRFRTVPPRSANAVEVLLEPDSWDRFADHGNSVHEDLEQTEMLGAVRDAIEETLTPHQREVFSALALNEVPAKVLAERLGTTRGAPL